jgi:hypothetical protein
MWGAPPVLAVTPREVAQLVTDKAMTTRHRKVASGTVQLPREKQEYNLWESFPDSLHGGAGFPQGSRGHSRRGPLPATPRRPQPPGARGSESPRWRAGTLTRATSLTPRPSRLREPAASAARRVLSRRRPHRRRVRLAHAHTRSASPRPAPRGVGHTNSLTKFRL